MLTGNELKGHLAQIAQSAVHKVSYMLMEKYIRLGPFVRLKNKISIGSLEIFIVYQKPQWLFKYYKGEVQECTNKKLRLCYLRPL